MKLFATVSLASFCLAANSQITDNQRIGAYIPGGREVSAKDMKEAEIKRQLQSEQLQHPLRKVGNQIYDLKPLADWIKSGNVWDEWSGKPQPCKDWHEVYGYVKGKQGDVIFLWQKGLDRYIAVRNFPASATDGKKVYLFAVHVGNYDAGTGLHELWDCGKSYVPPPPTPAQLEAAKLAAKAAAEKEKKRKEEAAVSTLKWHQERAEQGDAYAQFRMGERYLAGDGVEKDEAKAREFFSKSAVQGNKDAEAALAKLKQK